MTARDRAARRELGYSPAPTQPPPIAGTADTEREPRLDAERVTLEFAQRSTKRADSGKLPIEFSPLFGGDPQQNLFED